MKQRNGRDDGTLIGPVLAVIGLLGLLMLTVIDWAGGETVVQRLSQGDGQAVEIRTHYGWSGIRWYERMVDR